jgi:hypothetical protein
MKQILAALSAVPLLLVLGGCGQVQDAAQQAASDAASGVANAAADEVKKQACSLIGDGMVSVQDKQVLGGLVSAAEAAGLPAEFTSPLRQIAQAGDQVPAESVNALKDACAS